MGDFTDDGPTARRINAYLESVPLLENRKAIAAYLVRRRSGSKPLEPSSLRSAAQCLAYWAQHLGTTAFAAASPSQLHEYLAKETYVRSCVSRAGNRFDRTVRPSEATKWLWKIHIRRFLRVMCGQAKAKELFHGIRIGRQPHKSVKRSELLTSEEFERVLALLNDPCDRCLWLLLAETAHRVSELCSLNVGNVRFTPDGPAIISIPRDGDRLKTGSRPIPVLRCVVSLKAWLDVHPRRDDPHAPLLVNRRLKKGTRLTPTQIEKLVRAWCRKAGITRRVWPHLLRHTRNTQLAREGFTDSIMRKISGWAPTSPMPSHYEHLAGQDVDDFLYPHWGLKKRSDSTPIGVRGRTCPHCGQENLPHAFLCQECAGDLSAPAPAKPHERTVEELLQDALDVGDISGLLDALRQAVDAHHAGQAKDPPA